MLPENVVAETDLVKACTDADVLVFVVPHQHVAEICAQIKGKVKLTAVAISLIKVYKFNFKGQIKSIFAAIF
jgi:glycerol-3-phosphate dehydrogenase (NAD+)